MSSLFVQCKQPFRDLLTGGGVRAETVADLEVETDIYCATHFLSCRGGKLGKAVQDKDFVAVQSEVTALLSIDCKQGAAMDATDRDRLARVALIMPTLASKEDQTILGSIEAKVKHDSQYFPAGMSSAEARADYSVGVQFSKFEVARPGAIVPSSRFSTKLLNAVLMFALFKAGLGTQSHAIASVRPNFAKIALKAGTSFESIGGADSKLFSERDGEEIEPRSIGVLTMYWGNWLRQVFAMLQVKLPDGSMYGQEAGITVLENCFSLFASQRPTVAAICSALTEGWRKFVDLLVVSTDSFVDVCRKVQTSDHWLESDLSLAPSGANKGTKDDSNTVKQLKAELASIKKSRGRFGNSPNGRNSYSFSPNGTDSVPPCFNFFAGRRCAKDPCLFRHTGPPPAFNPAASPNNDRLPSRPLNLNNGVRR